MNFSKVDLVGNHRKESPGASQAHRVVHLTHPFRFKEIRDNQTLRSMRRCLWPVQRALDGDMMGETYSHLRMLLKVWLSLISLKRKGWVRWTTRCA